MAKDRLELQHLLEDILGSRRVYYQPPSSIKMSYPAVIYSRNDIQNNHADNNVYTNDICYKIIVLEPNPDSKTVTKISKLPKCRFVQHYAADNLNHDVFELYY